MQRKILERFAVIRKEMNFTENFDNGTKENQRYGLEMSEGRLQTTNVVVMAITLIVIFVISFAGNVFVFLIFYKRPALVTISNRFIVNLSVCNVLETLFVMPFVFAALVTQDWKFGQFWCQTTGFLMNAIFAASTLTLVIIAIDRYCAVVRPLHYSMHITSRRCGTMIATVWFLAVCCSIPPLIGWNRYEYQRNKLACTAVSTSRKSNDMTFTIFIVSLCFIIPLFIIISAYIVIFKAAKNNSDKVRKNSMVPNSLEDHLSQTPLRQGRRMSAVPILVHRLSVSTRSNLWRRDEWKAAVTSFMVVFTFIVCWLLYFIIIILECLIEDPRQIKPVIKTVSILLAMSSCALNPLVYVFRSKIQRVELKGILGIHSKRDSACSGTINPGCSRRTSMSTYIRDDSPCISRQGSEESDIITKLHHVTTATTLTSMMVTEEAHEIHENTRT